MPRAVQRRSAISLLANYGSPAVLGLACAYQLYRLSARVHAIERRVDNLILDADTDNAARAIREVMRIYSTKGRKPWVRLVNNKRSATEG